MTTTLPRRIKMKKEFKVDNSKFKENIGNFTKTIGKAAKEFAETAVLAADQNDDGKFDFDDISSIAESVGQGVKKSVQFVKTSTEEKNKLFEQKTLQPIFAETLDDANFSMPKFVRIVERDKRYIESEVCQGSIGYNTEQKGLKMVNIFTDSVDIFGLSFYPDAESDFYYVNPVERDNYIALNEYFDYLKIARVNELRKLAQDLGAKYFKVTLKEEQSSLSEKKIKLHAKAGAVADAAQEFVEKKYTSLGIAAESRFSGHAPIQPQLKYLQRDPTVQNLIAMRMDKNGEFLGDKLMIKMSKSSGMKETDAIKIDTVLKGLKCSGSTTVESQAKNEAKRYFEYEIEF